jgi:DNA processing protein
MGFGIISVYKGKMKLIAIDELVMKKEPNHETKLKRIFDKTLALIDEFHPDEVALEAPFFGKNVQSMLKLGRAQGAAMGVDALAHQGANSNNTIAVVANGLDIRYPSINKNLIIDIEKNGLILSAYKESEKAKNYTFVLRNEIVVALSEFLIVTQADIDSGSLTSVNYALKMGKTVYTLPHRINESLGTQELVKKGLIKVIYDNDENRIIMKYENFIVYIKKKEDINKILEEIDQSEEYEGENVYISLPLPESEYLAKKINGEWQIEEHEKPIFCR